MILTVKAASDVYLVIRQGKPSPTAAVAGHLVSNDPVDVVDVVAGDDINGNSTWYLRKDGNYCWSGGFFPPDENHVAQNYIEKKIAFLADPTQSIYHNNTADESKWKVSWGHVDMEIWKMWKTGNMGSGVKVAVIDTGLHDQDNDLRSRVIKSKSFVNDTMEDADPYHGTMSAGLIGANGAFAKTVFGVAPLCQLYVYRAASEGFSITNICSAIQEAVNDGVKIISMSFGAPDNATLQSWVTYCASNGIILVASAGDVEGVSKMYPASYQGCLSIGGYYLSDNKSRLIDKTQSAQSDVLALVAPSRDVLTTSTTAQNTFHQATSAACAFVAGVLALVVEKYPSLNYSRITTLLRSNSVTDSVEKTTDRSDSEGYGVLRAKKMLDTINV